MKTRPMALTPDLVARVHRAVEDAGQEPGLSYQTDEDYDAAVEATMVSHPAGQDHLALCLRLADMEAGGGARRSAERHGPRVAPLVLLPHRAPQGYEGSARPDDGARPRRTVPRRSLPASARNLRAQLGKLFRREFTVKPQNSIPRWISVETEQGAFRGARLCDEPRRAHLCRTAPARGDCRHPGQSLRALGLRRRLSAEHGRAPGGARHSRPQFVALARAWSLSGSRR